MCDLITAKLQHISVIFVEFFMNNKISPFWSILPVLAILLIDIYVYQAIKTSFSNSKSSTQRIALIVYCLLSTFAYISLIIFFTKGISNWHGWSKNVILGVAQAVTFGKLLILPFVLIDDIIRFLRWAFGLLGNSSIAETQPNGISRLQFLSKVGLIMGSSFFGALIYGITRGAYNYKTVKIKLPIPNLPDEFKDLKILQISDMHLGSFADSTPVQKIVDLINVEKADIVFFTGDLVNYTAKEIEPYISNLKQI